jgi:ribosomal protein S18 acetylase RimI-like enzyme
LEVDGGRLKLEWSVLRARVGRDIEDLLWWEADQLVGFLGLYAFGPPTIELVGMVDPVWRRRGIATSLLDAALPLCLERRYEKALFVVPRTSKAGKGFALRRGAVLEHSEHALVLSGAPLDGPAHEQISVRAAEPADVPAISALLTAAFGGTLSDVSERLTSDIEQTLLVEVEGCAIATVRLAHEGDTGSVYGFAVDPAWQNRGIGRDVLRRVCSRLRDEGAQRVQLEVAVDNDRALGLYTSIGFTQVSTEDYYEVILR